MIDDGFIHLYRSMLTTSFARKPNLVAAWVHCLLLASWKEYDTMIGMTPVHLKPGQFITGRKRFAEETGLSENVVRNALSHFSNQGMIKVDTSQGQAASIVTIVNWETYQNIGQSYNQGSTKVQPSKNQAITKPSPLYEELQEVVSPIEAKASITPQGGSPLPEQQETTATAAHDMTFSEKTPASPVDDSEAADKAITLPTPSKANSGARKREKKACSDDVKAVIEAYREIKPSDTTRGRGKKNIASRMKEGFDKETLIQCIERYRRAVDYEPQFLKGVGNFFGDDATYDDYLDENFTEPEPKRISAFGTLEEQMEAFGLVNTYKWTPEDDLIHIPTPEEEAAKWEAFFEREKKREQEEAHEHTPVS